MKAAVRDRYGPVRGVEIQGVDKPDLATDNVLVRGRAG